MPSSIATRILGCAALLAGFAGTARAIPTCQGSIGAGLLHPLPMTPIVRLDTSSDSDRNKALAQQFTGGLAQAGVITTGTANVLMRLTVSFNQLGGGAPAAVPGAADRGVGPRFSDFSFGNVGNFGTIPNVNTGRIMPRRRPPSENALFLRAEVRDVRSSQILWIASVSCTVQTDDDGRLAFELGRVIGGAMGKRIERAPI